MNKGRFIIECIPFKTFKEKISIVKRSSNRNVNVSIEDNFVIVERKRDK